MAKGARDQANEEYASHLTPGRQTSFTRG
jgi:hypothetical protein